MGQRNRVRTLLGSATTLQWGTDLGLWVLVCVRDLSSWEEVLPL